MYSRINFVQDAMESLHGVMMHGDYVAGKDHVRDHNEMMKNKDENKKDKPGVKVNAAFLPE